MLCNEEIFIQILSEFEDVCRNFDWDSREADAQLIAMSALKQQLIEMYLDEH